MKHTRFIIALICLIIPLQVFSWEFEKINLDEYDKKIISEKQIRFVNKKNPQRVIHLQIGPYDQSFKWKNETLKDDVDAMFNKRKVAYDLLGFSDVHFNTYELAEVPVGSLRLPQLNIYGSYKKANGNKTYFLETNIYFKESFFQIKIIDSSKEIKKNITEKEVGFILAQIKTNEMETKK